MAGWISSKLKVAESLLQQIDQQAAESLGKGERKQSDELDFKTYPKPSGIVSLRDQLKKKTPEGDEIFGKLSSDYAINSARNKISKNDNNQKLAKEVAELDSNPRSSLKDSDWTELLSTPKQRTPTKINRIDNGVLGMHGVKKVGRKVSNVGLDMKDNGKNIGIAVRKASDGNAGKESDGVGDGKSDGEKSRTSCSAVTVSGVRSEGKTFEGWESGQDLGKVASPEGKKEVEHDRKIKRNGNVSLDPEKLVAKADSPLQVKNPDILDESNGDMIDQMSREIKEAAHGGEKIRRATSITNVHNEGIADYVLEELKKAAYSGSDDVSDSDSESSSNSDSQIEREREERIRRRQQILASKAAAKAAAKAAEAIEEQENVVARLEGEKQSLEKILEERTKQAEEEALELQSTMIEMMEAAELEKQKHNHTRMELLARLGKLETTNADLAMSLASTQWNLEIEVNRVAELRHQINVKEYAYEELKRKISSTDQRRRTSLTNLLASKGIELEKEMLEAEYSFVTDKIARLEEKATNLQANIDFTLKEMENSTEVEVELKRRLSQMTDHLIQKQAQVEALSSDKATLLFRIEAVSRLLDENKSVINAREIFHGSREDLEAGTLKLSGANLRPMFKDKIQSGKQHLGSLLRQLDAIFSAGALFLARNPAARIWSLVYLCCLHFWALYILFSHSRPAEDAASSSVVSLANINNTNGV